MMTVSGSGRLIDAMFGRIPNPGEVYAFNGINWLLARISAEFQEGSMEPTYTTTLRELR